MIYRSVNTMNVNDATKTIHKSKTVLTQHMKTCQDLKIDILCIISQEYTYNAKKSHHFIPVHVNE